MALCPVYLHKYDLLIINIFSKFTNEDITDWQRIPAGPSPKIISLLGNKQNYRAQSKNQVRLKNVPLLFSFFPSRWLLGCFMLFLAVLNILITEME